MTEYRFGNKDKPHKFCPTCGKRARPEDHDFWGTITIVGTSMLIDFRDSPYESEKPHYAINVSSCENREAILLMHGYR